jgi:hypothetical protein
MQSQKDTSNPKKKNPQSRYWMFTLNNPTDNDINEIREFNNLKQNGRDGSGSLTGTLLTDANLASAQSSKEEKSINDITTTTTDTTTDTTTTDTTDSKCDNNQQNENLSPNSNHMDTNYKTLLGIPFKRIKYFICQLEKGEQNGTIHIQGYVEFTTNVHFEFFRKKFNSKMHISIRQKSREACIEYCSKTETRIEGPYEYGDRHIRSTAAHDRERTLLEIQQRITDGASAVDIANEHFDYYLRYGYNIRTLINDMQMSKTAKFRNWKTKVYVLTGKTGIGKSRFCNEHAPDAFKLKRCNGGAVWWDGYDGHDDMVLDDFYGWIPLELMLDIMDRYKCPLEQKGKGGRQLLIKRLFVTSNHNWEDWYKGGVWEGRKDAFERRISHFINPKEPSTYKHLGCLQKPPIKCSCDDTETTGTTPNNSQTMETTKPDTNPKENNELLPKKEDIDALLERHIENSLKKHKPFFPDVINPNPFIKTKKLEIESDNTAQSINK